MVAAFKQTSILWAALLLWLKVIVLYFVLENPVEIDVINQRWCQRVHCTVLNWRPQSNFESMFQFWYLWGIRDSCPGNSLFMSFINWWFLLIEEDLYGTFVKDSVQSSFKQHTVQLFPASISNDVAPRPDRLQLTHWDKAFWGLSSTFGLSGDTRNYCAYAMQCLPIMRWNFCKLLDNHWIFESPREECRCSPREPQGTSRDFCSFLSRLWLHGFSYRQSARSIGGRHPAATLLFGVSIRSLL